MNAPPDEGGADPAGYAESAARDHQLLPIRKSSTTTEALQLAVDAALAYARRGWPVFPVRPDKRPFTTHGHAEATTDETVIVGWWQRWPRAQVGVACGPSGLAVVDLDVDAAKGKDGLESFATYLGNERDGCGLVATTPRGGRHLYYADPARTHRCAVDVGEWLGVDVRADGGYVIVPSPASPGREWDIGEWHDDADLCAPPPHVDALMRGSKAPKNTPSNDGPNTPADGKDSGTAMPLPEHEVARIRAALAVIPSDSRDVWIRVGMSLKSTCAKEQAYAIWCDWSKSSSKFDPVVQREQWNSLREYRQDGSEVTIGTLFHLAQQFGYEGEDVDLPQEQQAVEVKADATGRPVVDTSAPYHLQVARALDVLRQRSDIAQREGRLVRVVDLNRLRTAPLTRGAIRELLSESVRWIGRQGTKPREVDPPALVVDALTEHRHDWPLPVLRADASASAAVQAIRDRGAIQRIPTGITAIDFATGGGLPRIGRVGLQGPPSASKTLLMVAMLDSMANRGVHVGLLAVDEDREDIVGRLLQRRGCERRDVDDLVSVDVERALRDVEHMPLRIYDATWTIDRCAADLARVAGDGPMVLGIDSIQTARCDADDDVENETTNVAARMQAIRDASVRHRMLVVATSEVGRAAYRDVEGRSAVAALAAGKHSGSIEYAMRVLVDLRPARGTDDIVELRFAKNKIGAETRPGEPGAFVRIDRATQTVAPADDYQPPAEDAADDERLDAARQHAAVVALWLADHPGRGRREMHRGLRGQGTARTAADAGLGVLENSGAIVEQRAPRNAVWTYLDGGRVPDEVLAHVRPEDRARIRAVRPPQPPPDGPDGECAAECASTLDTLTTGTPSSVCVRPPIGGATHSHSASVQHDVDDGVPERPKGRRKRGRRSKSARGSK